MNRLKVMEMVKNILLAVAMVATGVIFLIANLLGDVAWIKFVVWGFMCVAVYMIVHYFVNVKELHNNNSLVIGIVLFFAGLFMTIFEFYEFTLYFYPLFLATAGALALGDAMHRNNKGCKTWWQPLILAIIQLVFALIYILLWRFIAGGIYMYLLGAELVIDGIYVCVAQFVFKRECKKVETTEEQQQ